MRLFFSVSPRPVLTALVSVTLISLGAMRAEAQVLPRQDEIVLQLSDEEWVETKTATVIVAIDLAVTAGNFGAARAEVERDLRTISAKAKWRLTRFNKLRDEAGYERWRVLAEARLPGAVLSSLGPTISGASRPGRGFRIQGIDYTPTLGERQTALATLRARLYARAGQEIASINKAFPGRGFRIGTIDFTSQAMIGQPMMDSARSARIMATQANQAAPATAVAEKLTVSARVIVAARAPESK
jgi:hypothetical protein